MVATWHVCGVAFGCIVASGLIVGSAASRRGRITSVARPVCIQARPRPRPITRTQARMCALLHACIHVCMLAPMHACTHACMHASSCVCDHVCALACGSSCVNRSCCMQSASDALLRAAARMLHAVLCVVHAASCMDLLHAVAKLVAYDNAECGADAEVQQHDAELQSIATRCCRQAAAQRGASCAGRVLLGEGHQQELRRRSWQRCLAPRMCVCPRLRAPPAITLRIQ